MRQLSSLCACVLLVLLPACGGGRSTPSDSGVLPAAPAHPHASASPAPAPAQTVTPAPISDSSTAGIPNTNGRIGTFQVFDYRNGYMPASQIRAHASKIDAVWGSVEPAAWKSAHPGMLVSDYFIMGLDQYSVTHHSLSWWQKNHPSWILYACDGAGHPTHDVAYMKGVNVDDVPIDIGNPDAVAYQLDTMARAAKDAGYNALAIDEVLFSNVYAGGNPSFGQRVKAGEYGCGAWNGGTFVHRYSARADARYAADVVNYVAQARSIAHRYGLTVIVNHPAGPLSNSNEQRLLEETDVEMDETGFSAYGRYRSMNGQLLRRELAYARYAQEHGKAMFVIDKFANEAHVDKGGLEYSIATYLLGNEGAMLLFAGGVNEYGTMQYHSEYDARVGRPCTTAAAQANVYSRRFTGGISVVNGSAAPQTFKLPPGSYRDLEGRPISGGTLRLGPNDAYVLLGGSGC